MPFVDGIEIFSVKLVDGFTKSLCVQAIFALLNKLEYLVALILLLWLPLTVC